MQSVSVFVTTSRLRQRLRITSPLLRGSEPPPYLLPDRVEERAVMIVVELVVERGDHALERVPDHHESPAPVSLGKARQLVQITELETLGCLRVKLSFRYTLIWEWDQNDFY